MNKHYEFKYHRLEDTHWFFIARRAMIFGLIKQLNIKQNSKILDIGCSSGSLMQLLARKDFKNVYGIDKSINAVNLCKKRGFKNVNVMDAAKTKFNNDEFDVIITSDILEHIKNDNSALKEWNRILKHGGKLIIFVPAFDLLWSKHDEINHHYRRYSKSELMCCLKKSNFKMIRCSYWNFSLFFPMIIFKYFRYIFLRNENQKSGNLYELNPFANKALLSLLGFENLVLKYLNFPFGVSIFTLAVKT